jgi:hypothetical protein
MGQANSSVSETELLPAAHAENSITTTGGQDDAVSFLYFKREDLLFRFFC